MIIYKYNKNLILAKALLATIQVTSNKLLKNQKIGRV
jgi:hypothetical protein